jgi:hypothetical protein
MSLEEEFYELLNKRFMAKAYTTERSITYTFFYLLAKLDLHKPAEILLEYPHPATEGNEKVDTYIPSKPGRKGLVLECKYDRKNTKNSPRPLKAGKIFNDLFRLGAFNTDKDANKWFVYVTDDVMASYLANNNFGDFFNLKEKSKLTIDSAYFKNRPDTFVKNVNKYGLDKIEITCVLSRDMANENKLRIYEIKN